MKFKIDPFILISLIAVFCMGFILGMVIQQQAIIKFGYEVARGLEGTTFNINIDLNETLIVDRMYENFGFDELNLTKNDSFEVADAP